MADTAHLGDALSALVDDELAGDELAAARRHLDGCGGCRDELAATEAVALAVRGLPPVDARFGFYERLVRPGGFAAANRHRLRAGMAVATAAAVIALVVGLAGDLDGTTVAPPVDDMVEVHQAGFLPQSGFEAMPAADMADMEMALPTELDGGFEREAVYQGDDDVMAIAYRSGDDAISVFEQDGRLDTDALDASMDAMAHDAWGMDLDGVHALVVDRHGLVYTLVGDAPIGVLMAIIGDLPDGPSSSLVQRARDAGTEVVWTFGLGD